MAFQDYQRLIIGFHGCDQKVADSVLRGVPLRKSDNNYDWLGEGIYFWEHGPARAMEWAQFMASRSKSAVSQPAVVGALIQLGNCFDLLDVKFTRYLKTLWPDFEQTIKDSGNDLPRNDPVFHRLDCAFLNWAILEVEEQTSAKFQTVRGVFVEGDPLYPTGHIYDKSHIQIAVRDPASIVGFFHPARLDASGIPVH